MFAPNLTSEERVSIAKGLRGATVIALAQECARQGDLDGLKSLHQAGHFDFDIELAQSPSQTWKIHHTQQLKDPALPMIDALVCAIEAKETVPEIYATPHTGEKSIARTTVTRLAANRPLWDFISKVCADALDRFDQLFDATPPNETQDAIGNNRIRTANVVAFIAAASNDPDLYDRAKRSYSDAGRRLHEGPAIDHVIGERANLTKISAQGVAVAMGSVDVLNAHVTGSHVRHTMGKKRSGDSETATDVEYLLAASTGGMFVGTPQPELIMWMLNASLDDEYAPEPSSTNGEKFEQNKAIWAMNLFGRDWSHCVEAVMERHPSYVHERRPQAFIFAVRSGLETVATRLLDEWPEMRNGPVQEDGVLVWGEHPIKSIIPSRTHHGHIADISTSDIDSAVVFMARYMDDRNLLSQFVERQANFFPDTAFVHAIAQQNLNSSLVYMAEKGLDLEALSGGRRATEIIEFVEDTKPSREKRAENAETLRILRALSAKQSAEAALTEFTSHTPKPP